MTTNETAMTEIQILEETLNHYHGHPERFGRGDDQLCRYRVSDQAMCAIGRCVDWDTLPESDASAIAKYNGGSGDFLDYFGERVLRAKYAGHTTTFWAILQSLHDTTFYWDIQGNISPLGLRFVIENFPDFDCKDWVADDGNARLAYSHALALMEADRAFQKSVTT